MLFDFLIGLFSQSTSTFTVTPPCVAALSGDGEWTVGDAGILFTATCKDANGAVDLTSATAAYLHLRRRSTGAVLTPSFAATITDQTVTNNKGVVTYRWGANDLIQPPDDCEYEIRCVGSNWAATFHGELPIKLIPVMSIP